MPPSPTEFERPAAPATADLQILVRVADLGTLSAVARERNVPVSVISRAVSRLEKEYQVRLITRSTHGLSITPEGELLLGHARHIVDSLSELSAELDTRSGTATGLVRLSVSQVMGYSQIIPSLPALIHKHPGLRVDVIADDRTVDLATEGIDLAVRTDVVVNENLVARHVGEYGRAIYASQAYLNEFGEPTSPDQLSQHRCVTHAISGVLNRWQFKIGRKNTEQSVHGYFRANNSAMLLAMVKQGIGIGRLNTAIAGPLVDTGDLIPILEEFRNPTRFPIYLVMLPDRHRLPKIRACADHLAKLYKKLQDY
ncbi:MAG: LysR family transcriptional regulator [Burkholderiaceae bacterium]